MDSSCIAWCKVQDTHLSDWNITVTVPLQTTLLLFAPLYLKSGMLHTLCDLSSLSIPLSTSSDTVLRSLNPAPSAAAAAEVRPTVLPKGLILIRDLKFMRDMLMARLLFHWRASRCASCSSFRWSRASMRTERKRPDTSCASGSLACITSRNLCRAKHKRDSELRNDMITDCQLVRLMSFSATFASPILHVKIRVLLLMS